MPYTHNTYTFDEFLARADHMPDRMTSGHGIDSRSVAMPGWYGTRDFAGAMHLALTGWTEGRERIARSLVEIAQVGEDLTSTTYDVAGNEPDVARYLEGDPENMLAFLPTDERRIVRIFACVSIRCDVDQETVFTRGAAVVALADRLERMGNQTEIIMVDCTEPTGGAHLPQYADKHITTVAVKRPGQPLDLDRLAFVFAHLSCQRRLMFSIKENDMLIDASHRAPTSIPAEITRGADIILPEANGNDWTSPARAAAWINANVCRFEQTANA